MSTAGYDTAKPRLVSHPRGPPISGANRQPLSFAMIAFASAIEFARIFTGSSPGEGLDETVIS